MKLWYRLGDAGEYETADEDFDALGLALFEAGVRGADIDSWTELGLRAPGFEGQNYISLYWGDDEGGPLRALDEHDRRNVHDAIIRASGL